MARLARIAAVNVAYHVTQRGNAKQFLLVTDEERAVYLDLLRKNIRLHGLQLLGYCLMSNHVHLVAIPQKRRVAHTSVPCAPGNRRTFLVPDSCRGLTLSARGRYNKNSQ